MMTSDFILPNTTLNPAFAPNGADPPVLQDTVRVWDFQKRKIVKTITVPGGVGMMDVRLIPGDPHGRAYSAGMFNGIVYLIDPHGRDGHTGVRLRRDCSAHRDARPGGHGADPPDDQ